MAKRRTRGTGTIREPRKKGGTWGWALSVRDASGKRRQISRYGYPTRDDAQEALNDALKAQRRGRVNADTRATLTVAELVNEWLDHASAQGDVKPSTLDLRRRAAVRLLKYIGDTQCLQLNQRQLDHVWRAMVADHGWSQSTRQQCWTVLTGACKWGFRDANMLLANPCDRLSAPKRLPGDTDEREHVVWNREQLDAFIAHALSMKDRRAIGVAWALAAVTGMRRGELGGLRWSDVCLDGCAQRDDDRPHVHVRRAMVRVGNDVQESTPKTKAAVRVVTLLEPSHVQFMRDWKREQTAERLQARHWRGGDAVFTHSVHHRLIPLRTMPLRATVLSQLMAEACDQAGVPRTHLHGLRHQHASQLLAYGFPVTEVAARLGHAKPSITLSIYSHAGTDRYTDERQAELWAAGATR